MSFDLFGFVWNSLYLYGFVSLDLFGILCICVCLCLWICLDLLTRVRQRLFGFAADGFSEKSGGREWRESGERNKFETL